MPIQPDSMCLILFSFQPDSDRPLVLGANRDEFFARPTVPAHYWKDQPDILAGRDLQAGGTWLGVTRQGRFAAITNVREPGDRTVYLHSRGKLTTDFLKSRQSPDAYLNNLASRAGDYAGFNLLVGAFAGSSARLYYFSNRQGEIQALSPGTYGLSNHLLDSPWPKVNDGKEKLRQRLNEANGDHTAIRDLLEHPVTAEDHRLPDTGISYEREKALSAIFIAGLPDYGTRASTVVTVETRRIRFSEQNYQPTANVQPNVPGNPGYFEMGRWNTGRP